jgi:hypothetical protein
MSQPYMFRAYIKPTFKRHVYKSAVGSCVRVWRLPTGQDRDEQIKLYSGL